MKLPSRVAQVRLLAPAQPRGSAVAFNRLARSRTNRVPPGQPDNTPATRPPSAIYALIRPIDAMSCRLLIFIAMFTELRQRARQVEHSPHALSPLSAGRLAIVEAARA